MSADLAREPLDSLAGALWWTALTAAGLGAVALLLPGALGIAVAVAAVTVIVAGPLLRVVWLIAAWARTGDQRFVLTGCVLLAVVAAGAALAVVT